MDEGQVNACGECGVVPEELCNGEDDDCDGEFDEGCPDSAGNSNLRSSEVEAGFTAGNESAGTEQDDSITVIVGGDEAEDDLMVGEIMEENSSADDAGNALLNGGQGVQGYISIRLSLLFLLWLALGRIIRKLRLQRVSESPYE